MPNNVQALPKLWKIVFWCEIPLTLGAIAFWVMAPQAFLAQLLGENPVANSHAQPLLYNYAGVVFSLVAWLYTRFLLQKTLHIPSFCLFQEALLVGDLWIVLQVVLNMPTEAAPLQNALISAAMAGFWGSVRAVYLIKNRWGRV